MCIRDSCKTYNAYGKQHCTQHRVEYETLYRLVLNKTRECAKAALMDGEDVAGRLTNTGEAEQKGQREALELSLIHICFMYGLIALNFIIPFVMVFVGYILKMCIRDRQT